MILENIHRLLNIVDIFKTLFSKFKNTSDYIKPVFWTFGKKYKIAAVHQYEVSDLDGSGYKPSPHPVQMTWKLEGAERAYEHFGPPFLLTTSSLYQKIRNIQLRILPDDVLLAIEVSKYDQKVVLEALHNCIAHQDYTRNGRILVVEMLDRLIFENEGSFYEGQPNDYIAGNKTPRKYRNPFLVQAMTELNMIDTMGYGIYEMHLGQARRYFPLPDYDLSDNSSVKMTIYGSVVDPAYSRLLIQKTDLSWEDILLLDRVQKNYLYQMML